MDTKKTQAPDKADEKGSEFRILIRVKHQNEVFFVELSQIREENTDTLYLGFGNWGKTLYLPVEKERLLQVQADLRLCVEEFEGSYFFCDLSQEEINADPFGLLQCSPEVQARTREYLPHEHQMLDVFLSEDNRQQWRDTMEDALFSL